MNGPVDDGLIRTLARGLSKMSIRASVVASNLANVDTPGYRAVQADFTDELEGASMRLRRTEDGHLPPRGEGPGFRTTLVEPPLTRMRQDGNTVDVDREMTEFAVVQGRYTTLTELVRKRFALLRYTVTDGRG